MVSSSGHRTIVAAAWLLAPALLLPRTAFATVDVANTGTATVAWINYLDGAGTPAGTTREASQSFTTNFDLVSIHACIWLRKMVASPLSPIRISVNADTGGAGPGAELAFQTFSGGTTTVAEQCFDFTLNLTAGSTYHIRAGGDLLDGAALGWAYGFAKKDNYAGGSFYNTTDGGATWTNNTGWDAIFRITGELPAGSFPTLTSPYDYLADQYPEPLFKWTAPPNPGPYHFRVERATDPAFTTGLVTRASNTAPAGFLSACGAPPWAAGCAVQYKVQAADALAGGTTYWWRVSSSKSPFTAWSPSSERSLTVDTALTTRGWRITTTDQFTRTTSLTNLDTSAGEAKLVTVGPNHALLAAGSTITATSTLDPNIASNAGDGDLLSPWVSGVGPVTTTQELVVNLGQARVLQKINMESNGNATNVPKEYTFETSDTGLVGSWTVRATNTAGGAFFEVILSPTVTATYVKMRITKSAGGGNNLVRVDEFRAVGVPPATGSLVTLPVSLSDLAVTPWPDARYVVTIPDAVATMKVTAQKLVAAVWTDTAVVDGPFTGVLTGATRTLVLSSLGSEAQLRFRIDYTAGSTGVLASFTAGGSGTPLTAASTFSARWGEADVRLDWETTDDETLGFDLRRALDPDGPAQPITPESIPAESGELGSQYAWTDAEVEAGTTYYYWLDEHRLDGSTRVTGPVAAEAAGPAADPPTGCACSFVTATSRFPGAGAALLALALFAFAHRRRGVEERARSH